MLKRLTSATATTNSSSYYPAWSEQFAYDGFGNLTSKTMNGTQQSIAVNSPTNQLSSAAYDANGNMLTGSGATLTYNEDNRMSSATVTGGGMEYYYYTPDGKRFWRQMTDGSIRFTLWGAQGEQLGVYYGDDAPISPQTMSVFFSGRLIYQGQTHYGTGYGPQPYQYGNVPGFVLPDRLGSNDSGGMMYPYGETPGVAGQDQVEFATYNRDSYTRFDNAVNRVYNSFAGRFNTADPYKASAGPSDPGTWNRYSYTAGDPVNRIDPRGLLFGNPPSYDDYLECVADGGWGYNGCLIDDEDPCGGDDIAPVPGCYQPYPTNNNGTSPGNNFTNEDAKQAASGALAIPACLNLIFGGTKWDTTKGAQNQLAIRDVLSSSQLPPGAPPLGAAVVQGTPTQWGSSEPWAENNGSAIYLNDLYFPSDTVANIKTPWGASLSAVQVFNHDHNTNLTPIQIE